MKMIACVDKKTLAIGNKGELIYKCKEDMAFFKAHTMGKIIVMGSKTYESMGGALRGRINIVLTRHPERYLDKTDALFLSLSRFLDIVKFMGKNTDSIVVIGGAEIYKVLIDYCDSVYLTKVYRNNNVPIEYDTVFPSSINDTNIWRRTYFPSKNVIKEYIWEDKNGNENCEEITYKFFTYKRKLKK